MEKNITEQLEKLLKKWIENQNEEVNNKNENYEGNNYLERRIFIEFHNVCFEIISILFSHNNVDAYGISNFNGIICIVALSEVFC